MAKTLSASPSIWFWFGFEFGWSLASVIAGPTPAGGRSALDENVIARSASDVAISTLGATGRDCRVAALLAMTGAAHYVWNSRRRGMERAPDGGR
jgi:hypothetical protein